MNSLCLAYKINYPVVRAHHRQHETSPSTLLRSKLPAKLRAREPSHQCQRLKMRTEPTISSQRRKQAYNRKEPWGSQRAPEANQRQSQQVEPTSHHRKHDITNPDHNFSTSHHKITYDSHEGHSKCQS
jgi:hypothetical protein